MNINPNSAPLTAKLIGLAGLGVLGFVWNNSWGTNKELHYLHSIDVHRWKAYRDIWEYRQSITSENEAYEDWAMRLKKIQMDINEYCHNVGQYVGMVLDTLQENIIPLGLSAMAIWAGFGKEISQGLGSLSNQLHNPTVTRAFNQALGYAGKTGKLLLQWLVGKPLQAVGKGLGFLFNKEPVAAAGIVGLLAFVGFQFTQVATGKAQYDTFQHGLWDPEGH